MTLMLLTPWEQIYNKELPLDLIQRMSKIWHRCKLYAGKGNREEASLPMAFFFKWQHGHGHRQGGPLVQFHPRRSPCIHRLAWGPWVDLVEDPRLSDRYMETSLGEVVLVVLMWWCFWWTPIWAQTDIYFCERLHPCVWSLNAGRRWCFRLVQIVIIIQGGPVLLLQEWKYT